MSDKSSHPAQDNDLKFSETKDTNEIVSEEQLAKFPLSFFSELWRNPPYS